MRELRGTPYTVKGEAVEYLGESRVALTCPHGHRTVTDHLDKHPRRQVTPVGVRILVGTWKQTGTKVHCMECAEAGASCPD